MIGGKLNLAKLHSVIQKKKGKTGEIECLIIPIEKNHLYKGKDGNVYLDLIAFDLKEQKDDQTHLVKQSFPKEVRDKMTEEEQKGIPILGNLNANIGGGSGSNNLANNGQALSEDDDVPF